MTEEVRNSGVTGLGIPNQKVPPKTSWRILREDIFTQPDKQPSIHERNPPTLTSLGPVTVFEGQILAEAPELLSHTYIS
jgi:hypothetical protein